MILGLSSFLIGATVAAWYKKHVIDSGDDNKNDEDYD